MHFSSKLRIGIFCFFLFLFHLGHAQTHVIDSLRKELRIAKTFEDSILLQTHIAHYFSSYNLDSVDAYCNNIIRQSKALDYKLGLFGAYTKKVLGYMCTDLMLFEDSLWFYMDKAFEIADDEMLINYYQLRSVLYLEVGKMEESVKDILLGIDMAKEMNDTLSMAYFVCNLGRIYLRVEAFDNLKNLFNNYDYCFKHIKGEDIYYGYLVNKIGALIHFEQYNKADSCAKVLEDYFLRCGDTINLIAMIQNRGLIFQKLNMPDSADIYYQSAINFSINKSSNEIFDIPYTTLVSYLIKERDYNIAKIYLDKTHSFYKRVGETLGILLAYEYYMDYFKGIGDYEQSLVFMQKYINLKDSLKIKGVVPMIDKLMAEKDLAIKKDEILQLKDQQKQKVNRREVLITLNLVSALGLLSIWYFLSKFIKSLKQNFSDTEKNKGRFLSYTPERYKMNYMVHIAISLLFGLLIQVIYFGFIINEGSSWGQLPVFIGSVLPFYFFEKCLENKRLSSSNIIMRKEFTIRLLSLVLFVLGLGSILAVWHNKLQVSVLFEFLYTIISAYFITAIAMVIIRYRYAITHVYNKAVNEFNAKLNSKINSETVKIKLHQNKIISVDNQGDKVNIDLGGLYFIKSDNVYQEFYLYKDGEMRKVLIRNTMSGIVEILKPYPNFYRCHRSYIVNLDKVRTIEGAAQKNYLILENCDEIIPISRTVGKQLLGEFHKLNV